MSTRQPLETEKGAYGSLPDDVAKDAVAKRWDWAVILWVVMVGDMARGILFPTLWPLVSSLGGDKVTQGFTVAAFSFGRIISSPLWGQFSNMKGYKMPLICSTGTAAIGAILYTRADSIFTLILSQICIGFGAGSLGVTRSWVAAHSSKSERTTAMATLSAMQFFGFTVTPFFGSALSVACIDTRVAPIPFLPWFVITKFTAPAYVMCLAFSIAILALLTVFTEPARDPLPRAKNANTLEDGEEEVPPNTCGCEGSMYALYMGLILNLVTRGVIGSFEAMGTSVAPQYGFDATDAGFIVSSFGMVGTAQLLFFNCYTSRFKDTQLILAGLFAMLLACIVMVHGERINLSSEVCYVIAILSIYACGYPVGNTSALGLYSKAAGSQPQGLLMGIFGSAGSGARIVFPILAGTTAQYLGFNVLFIILATCTLVTILFTQCGKKTLDIVTG